MYREEYNTLCEKDELMSQYDLVDAKDMPCKEQCFEALTMITEGIWGTADISEAEMERHFETLYDQVLNLSFKTDHLKYAPSNQK